MNIKSLKRIAVVGLSLSLALSPIYVVTANAAQTDSIVADLINVTTINTTELELNKGQSFKLIVENTDKSKAIKWKSSNSKVAKVSKNGNVKGIKKGKATITATVAGSKTKFKCKVTVTDLKNKNSSKSKYKGYQVDGFKNSDDKVFATFLHPSNWKLQPNAINFSSTINDIKYSSTTEDYSVIIDGGENRVSFQLVEAEAGNIDINKIADSLYDLYRSTYTFMKTMLTTAQEKATEEELIEIEEALMILEESLFEMEPITLNNGLEAIRYYTEMDGIELGYIVNVGDYFIKMTVTLNSDVIDIEQDCLDILNSIQVF